MPLEPLEMKDCIVLIDGHPLGWIQGAAFYITEPKKTKLWKEVLKIRLYFTKERFKLFILRIKFYTGFYDIEE